MMQSNATLRRLFFFQALLLTMEGFVHLGCSHRIPIYGVQLLISNVTGECSSNCRVELPEGLGLEHTTGVFIQMARDHKAQTSL